MIFVDNNYSVSAIFEMSLNLAISIDIVNRISTSVCAIAWTGLISCEWVFLGPWDIDERQSALFRVLRFYAENPLSSEQIVLSLLRL